MSLSDIPYMYSGESKFLKVTISDSLGNKENISGATFKWTLNVRNNPLTKDSSSGSITLVDPTNGVVQIYLQPSDTSSISGVFSHFLEMTDSQGYVSVVVDDLLNIKSR